MQEKVLKYMRQWNMVRAGTRILVGFSGGADSTALLTILWEYGKTHGIEVHALHVNHGIRGSSARRDQDYCEDFCRSRGIPYTAVCADVPGRAREENVSTEEAGRRARYEIFEEYIRTGKADLVALAHHQNDQAETMLFHLMRGTGYRGLRGMRPIRGVYIRPLLCVTRAEIEQYLRERRISWMEDESNQELVYTRNQIRYQVLEPMEQIRPGSTARMAGTAAQLLELEDYLDGELDRIWERTVTGAEHGWSIALEPFIKLHPFMQKQLIFRCLAGLPGGYADPEAVHAEQICALAAGKRGSRISLRRDVYAVLGYGELLVKRGYGTGEPPEAVSCRPGRICEYMGKKFVFTLEDWNKNDEIPVNRYTKWFDYDKINNSIALRSRHPGDYLTNAGGGHKKLKDYLIDLKIPREKRDQCILLADGSHIMWVVGMRISEEYKVTEETGRVLKVQMITDGGNEDGEIPY